MRKKNASKTVLDDIPTILSFLDFDPSLPKIPAVGTSESDTAPGGNLSEVSVICFVKVVSHTDVTMETPIEVKYGDFTFALEVEPRSVQQASRSAPKKCHIVFLAKAEAKTEWKKFKLLSLRYTSW